MAQTARGLRPPMAGLQANGPAPAPGMWAHWTGGRGRAAMDDQWSLASAETESCRAPQARRRPSVRAQAAQSVRVLGVDGAGGGAAAHDLGDLAGGFERLMGDRLRHQS